METVVKTDKAVEVLACLKECLANNPIELLFSVEDTEPDMNRELAAYLSSEIDRLNDETRIIFLGFDTRLKPLFALFTPL